MSAPRVTPGAPVAIDLFCGLGGWTEGLLAAGYFVVGFDIELHAYDDERYPAQLVIQDVLTLHGSQFADASLIVASPPCTEYSYMAMPWKRAKQIARALRGEDDFPEGYTGSRTIAELNALFDACFRIQREACEAAGRHIPLVVENVRGAQPWVGRAAWNYGSYFLWGDVPALMPMPHKAQKQNPDGTAHGSGSWFAVADSKNRGARAEGYKSHGLNWSNRELRGQDFTAVAGKQAREGEKVGDRNAFRASGGALKSARFTNAAEAPTPSDGHKNTGGSWFNVAHNTTSGTGRNPVHDAVKHSAPGTRENGKGSAWFGSGPASHGSKPNARKAASARIAKIPFTLARHVADAYRGAA